MATTLRAATSGGGVRRRLEQTARLWSLLEATQRGGFLLPRGYAGCVCDWACMDSGYAVCRRCGNEHWCCRGTCPEIDTGRHEHACAITGCIIMEYELRPERSVCERVGPQQQPSGGKRDGGPTPKRRRVASHPKSDESHLDVSLPTHMEHTAERCESICHMVESTVRELLASDKTRLCLEQERSRNDAKELSVFARLLRELAHDRRALRPNLVCLVSQVAFLCRKNRTPQALRDPGGLVPHCTDAITGLRLMHGGPRVARQMQNSLRYRDFVASLLYLCRVGVSFQGRQVLPRIDVLQHLLPLQVLLPSVFHIRSKAITEGENLIKLDLKQLPL